MGTATFQVMPKQLNAALLFAATDDRLRTYLNCICFEHQGSDAWIVGSDGAALAVQRVQVRDPSAPCGSWPIHRDFLERVARGWRGREFRRWFIEITIDPIGGFVTAAIPEGDELVHRLHPDRYTDWRRIVPSTTGIVASTKPISFDAHLLAKFGHAGKVLGQSSAIRMAYAIDGREHPTQAVAAVRLYSEHNFLGFVMPATCHDDTSDVMPQREWIEPMTRLEMKVAA